MKTIAICDDEPAILRQIHDFIREYCAQSGIDCEIRSFASADKLLAAFFEFDLILLDINMQGTNGMEAARRLRENDIDCPIIFVTGNANQVFGAFDVDAAHYILKPIDKQKLFSAMQKVFFKSEAKMILIKQGHGYEKILIKHIYYIEVIDRKIFIKTSHGTKECYGKLKELLPRLGEGFFQCHRSFAINLDYVSTLGDKDAIMDNDERIPTSRDKRKELANALLKHFRRGE